MCRAVVVCCDRVKLCSNIVLLKKDPVCAILVYRSGVMNKVFDLNIVIKSENP